MYKKAGALQGHGRSPLFSQLSGMIVYWWQSWLELQGKSSLPLSLSPPHHVRLRTGWIADSSSICSLCLETRRAGDRPIFTTAAVFLNNSLEFSTEEAVTVKGIHSRKHRQILGLNPLCPYFISQHTVELCPLLGFQGNLSISPLFCNRLLQMFKVLILIQSCLL